MAAHDARDGNLTAQVTVSGTVDVNVTGPYVLNMSLIHISEPKRLRRISYAVVCLKKKKSLSLLHISDPTELRRISYAVCCFTKKIQQMNDDSCIIVVSVVF